MQMSYWGLYDLDVGNDIIFFYVSTFLNVLFDSFKPLMLQNIFDADTSRWIFIKQFDYKVFSLVWYIFPGIGTLCIETLIDYIVFIVPIIVSIKR